MNAAIKGHKLNQQIILHIHNQTIEAPRRGGKRLPDWRGCR